MKNNELNDFSNDNKTIGDVAKAFQEIINDGKMWMLPKHQIEFIFMLDKDGICSIDGDISPEEARYRAENSIVEKEDDIKDSKAHDNVPIINNRHHSHRHNPKFSGRIFPPLSIRNKF